MKSEKSPRILSASAATLLLRPVFGLRGSLQRAGRWAGAAAVAALLGTTVQKASAGDYFWNGSVNNLWSNSSNWTPPGPPGSLLVQDNLFFGANANTSNVNDVVFPLFNSITFVSGAPSFVLGGNSLVLDAGGLTNNSSNLQTLAFADSFGGINLTNFNGNSQTWNAKNGDLLITAAVSFGAKITLIVTGDHNTTITGVISDAGSPPFGGSLVKEGAGVLRLTAKNTFPGDTVVNGGTLLVDGSTASIKTFVNPGGTLGGIGRVGGNVFNYGGIVAPGNSPGTLTVGRDYVQTSDGTLSIFVESKRNHSQLAVEGHADIVGSPGTELEFAL